ncbi:hypothetical protein [Massilia brevitalea]|uniref:hypothetical protein n=1 Tax=Massilia brevitalea TaxID=442526 RepID=UPI0027394198|nr:hypothetical protein [Massilia brevitalea]
MNIKFIYEKRRSILQRNIAVFTNQRANQRKKGFTMIALEYLPVGLAVLAVVARIAMFLPRQPKSQNQAA